MFLPKLALIHDMCGIGHCSMTVALPIISAMGIQGCPIPTAIFSNHTGYSEWFKQDFTEHLIAYIQTWCNLHVSLDGIYCGYLGSGAQTEAVLQLAHAYPDAPLFLDPVMGDHGKLYKAITPTHVAAMKQLTQYASYLVPNITEACVLTDTPYQDSFSNVELQEISQKLHQLGPAHVVITGLKTGDIYHNFISEYIDETQHTYVCSVPASGSPRPGTGDIFASVLFGSVLKKQPLAQAVQRAADFVADCIRISDEHHMPTEEGTAFEYVIPTLFTLPEA